jgi:large subunit ribosomal protein L18
MKKLELFERRKQRSRFQLKKNNTIGVRLSVYRSEKNIFAQVIDDSKGVTLAAASTLSKEFKGKSGGNIAAATEVGKMVAEAAVKAGVKEVVFDRGGYTYHGRVKAVAEAARAGGLKF